MSQKKLTKKLWKSARLLSDAAEMAEELEDYKRMVSQSQDTCQRLVKERDEARETIAALSDCDKLLADGYVFTLARPPNPRDDRGPYEATGVVTGGIRVHFRRPTIGAALSAMIDSLRAEEKA